MIIIMIFAYSFLEFVFCSYIKLLDEDVLPLKEKRLKMFTWSVGVGLEDSRGGLSDPGL